MKRLRPKHILMLWILFVLPALIVLVVGALLWMQSPGKPAPCLDAKGRPAAGSIAEKVFADIGGQRQGMFVKGRDIRNPLLLFLHGGPGMPTYFLSEKFPSGLEDHFTVCYWEQTGGGISFDPKIPADSMSVEKIIADAIAVIHYLRHRFGQDKIYLMGHSWGSFVGIQLAAQAPELFHAYVGVAQIARQPESEILAYRYMMEHYAVAGNERMLKKLEKYPVLEPGADLMAYFKSPLRDEAMHDLGIGTMHTMRSVITGVFFPVMQSRAYTVREKIQVWRAKKWLAHETRLLHQLFATDLMEKVPALEIPVYFCCGVHDYTVNYGLSKVYWERLEAPVKGFYTFPNAAHCPMHEEPERFRRIMAEDVLGATAGLSD